MMAPFSLTKDSLGSAKRIDWVDYAKGFCIVFVVMMHATLGVEKHAFEKGLVDEGITGWMNVIVTFAQPFRMPDFFMISGLFLGLVISRPWKRYIDRKVVHFLYFYILWLFVQFAFRSIGWVGEGLSGLQIAGKFANALVQPYGTLWFIYMLPVMFLITRLISKVHWLWVIAVAAVLEIAPVHTGWLLVDEFAARYVYFFAGYALAQPIFTLAAWARENVGKAATYLAAWAIVNGLLTLTPFPAGLVGLYETLERATPPNMAHLPFVSLALGTAGAIAVICLCAVLSRYRLVSVLRYLGQNSIVVYLAFFLPMVVSREILMRFAPSIDLGTMSLIVLFTSITCSVIAWEFTRITGWFKFFFIRPQWAKLDRDSSQSGSKASLQPAE